LICLRPPGLEGAVIVRMLSGYAVLCNQARACRWKLFQAVGRMQLRLPQRIRPPVERETSRLRHDKRAHSPSAANAPVCFNGRTPTIGPVKTQTSLAGSEQVRRHPRRRAW